MESKKINQLATELAPDLSDLTIIGDPTTGISKKITLSQMASLFTGTVEEYANFAAFPLVGVADTIYIALDTNVLYRWNTGTSAYVELSPNIINSLVFSDANGFDGNISLVGSVATLTITTALTTGSVPFIGASGALSQDNANLFFDDTNNRLGINTNAPTTALDVFGSGIIGRLNGTSTNNAFLGFSSAGTNKWSIGNVQSDHRFRIYNEATTSELVSVLSTGEFGIGIANPTTKFHIDGAASALIANLDANVSVAKSISFRSDNSNRINLEVSGTESGSNAGANFFIRRYSDAGALIDTPLTITRATGAATFISTVNATNGLLIGNGGATASSNYIPKFTSASAIGNSAIYDNGGNIGINNINSVNKLDIVQTGSNNAVSGVGLKIVSDAGSAASMAFSQSARGTGIIGMQAAASAPSNFVIGTDVTGNIIFKNGISGTDLSSGTDRLTINSLGNISIGVTMSNWDSTIKPIEIGNKGAFYAGFNGSASVIYMGNNAYYNGGWLYANTSAYKALLLDCGDGNFHFQNAPAGVAGNGISWVSLMRINSSGLVSIGGTTNTFIDYSSNVCRFYGGGGTNTFGLGAASTIYYQGDNNQFYPTADNARSIGLASNRYTAIWAVNGTIQTSDEREKTDIVNSDLGLDFINKLRPVSFKWKIGQNNQTTETTIDEEGNEKIESTITPRIGIRTHYGLIAQEVEELLNGKDFGGFIHDKESDVKGLRYDQFVPLLIKAIQEQQVQIEELKAKIK